MPLHQENEFESSVSPICLPWNTSVDMETQENQIATVAGWGRTVRRATKSSQRFVFNNNINANLLQELDLPIANEKCKTDPTTRTYISVFDPEIQICAGGEKGKHKKRKEVKNEVEIPNNIKMLACIKWLNFKIFFQFGPI